MLTDEERKKIYEEEEARLKAQELLKREAKPKGRGVSYALPVAIGVVVLLMVVCAFLSKGKTGKTLNPVGSSSSGTPTSIVPIIHVRNILTVAASDIKSTLKKELGPSAVLEYGKNCWGGTGWTARTSLATIEVTPWKGRVLEVMVHFNNRIPDRAAALAYLDIQPCTQTPDVSPGGSATWEYAFSGIYRVIVAPVQGGEPGMYVITITPSKELDDEFMSEN